MDKTVPNPTSRSPISKRLSISLSLYFVLSIIILGISIFHIIADNVSITLPLCGFLIGIAIGSVASRMYKISWNQSDRQINSTFDIIGILVLIAYLYFELNSDSIVKHYVQGPAVVAVSFALLAGLMYGRVLGTQGKIRRVFKEHSIINPHSTIMKIQKLEQSGFIITLSNGQHIGFDIGTLTPIEKLASFPKLDALLISHIHADHFSPDHIKALAPTKLFLNNECLAAFRGETGEEGPDGIEIVQVKTGDTVMVVPGVQVDYFTSDHGPNITAPVENLGWILRADGKVLYFPGDMFNPSGVPTADLVVDYALLPVGGFYTFGPQEAVNFADTFRSIGSVIPMHYEKDALNKDKFVAIAGERYNVLVD